MRWKDDIIKLNAVHINRRYWVYITSAEHNVDARSCQWLKYKKVFATKPLITLWRNQKWIGNYFKTWSPPLQGALARCLHLDEMLVVMLATTSAFICTVIEHQQGPRTVFHETFVNLHFRWWTHSDGNCICEASKVVVVEPRWWKACCGIHTCTVTLPMRNALRLVLLLQQLHLQIGPILSSTIHCCPCSRISNLIQAQEKHHTFHYKLRGEHSTAAPRYA